MILLTNFVQGNTAEVVKVEGQGRCMLEAGGYIFNTEAHPIDPAALACCSGLSEDEVDVFESNLRFYFFG